MAKKVLLYSTATCPYCTEVKRFLGNREIQFENFDVSLDSVKAQEMINKSGQMGVPVLDIEGEIIIGFDREAIIRALGL